MGLVSIPGVTFSPVTTLGSLTVTSVPVPPKSIIHHRFPRVGDTVTYNTTDAVRVGDGATTTFSLDSDGVPTIVGVDGTLGVKYGVYECTITYNGVQEVVPVSHLEDAAIEATFTTRTRDAEGYTVFTPSAGSRLLYVDPNEPNDTTAGVNADSNAATSYVLSTLPTADDWENPGAVNAYQTIAGAAAARRDGQPDWILLKRGEVFTPTAAISWSGISGLSATEPQMLIAYGTGARPWINPSATFSVNSSVINIFFEAYVGVSGIRIYPTFRDPAHGDFAGYANIDFSSGISVYTGGGPSSLIKGFIFEDNEVLYCNGGIGLSGDGGILDTVVRRNVVAYSYNIDNTSGFSMGSGGVGGGGADWQVLIEDNVLDHNGWVQPTISVSGTATSGNTTTLTEVGAFTGVDYATVQLTDDVGTGTTTITSNTDDTLTFDAAANVDFTSRTAYTIGGGQGAGQANIFNHNMYIRNFNNAIIRNNVIANGSSISVKTTSTDNGVEQHEMRDFIESRNLCIWNEIGLGGGGNTEDSATTRFQDMRVMDNVHVNNGEQQPTGRTLGWGFGMSDWNRGITGNNIIKDAGQTNSAVTNVHGYAIDSLCTDSILAYNKAIDIGPATGAITGDQGCLLINDTSTNSNITGLQILNNDFQQQNTDGLVVADWISAETSSITISDNRYYASRGDTDSYRIDTVQGTYAAYATETGETGQTNALVDYIDIGCSIPNYQIKRGGTATTAAFITEARAQEKGSWDTTLAADEVVAYFKDSLSDRPDITFEVSKLTLTNGVVGDEQNISFSNVGIPKGAIFIKPHTHLGAGTAYGACGYSIGFADDTGNQWVTMSNLDTENTPTQRSDSRQFDGAIAGFVNRGEWALADTNYFTNNQITVQLIDKGSTAEVGELYVIAIGGADVDSVKVGAYDDLGTTTGAQTLTTGHRTDMLFASTIFINEIHLVDTPDWEEPDTRHSFGVAINDGGTVQQMSLTRYHDDAFPSTIVNTSTTNGIYDDSILAKVAHPSTENYSVSIDSFTSTGVTLSCDATPVSEIFGYLSVSFKKRPKMKIVNTTVSATSNISITDIGFKGSFCFWQNLIGSTAYNTAEAIQHSAAITVADGTSVYTASSGANEGVTNIDAGCFAYGDEGFDIPVKGAGATLEVASTAGQLTFTNEGVDVTLGTQASASIPGRILVLGVN